MFPHEFFPAVYFADIYFPPILGEPFVPVQLFVMWRDDE
jgi:hypothetical protein